MREAKGITGRKKDVKEKIVGGIDVAIVLWRKV